MTFLANNIGYIIMGILALVALGGSGDSENGSDYADFDESAWANSTENPNGPNYAGI